LRPEGKWTRSLGLRAATHGLEGGLGRGSSVVRPSGRQKTAASRKKTGAKVM
jgi:hypothetical protein